MKAHILTVGDEILIGQVVDTNSAYLAQQLNAIGVWVSQMHSVGDRHDEIVAAIATSVRSESVVWERVCSTV